MMSTRLFFPNTPDGTSAANSGFPNRKGATYNETHEMPRMRSRVRQPHFQQGGADIPPKAHEGTSPRDGAGEDGQKGSQRREAERQTEKTQTRRNEMSLRKPHNQDEGYICEKIYHPSRSHIVIYLAASQGIDTGGKKYAVVCSAHNSIVSDSSLPNARLSMKHPAFCEGCMAGATPQLLATK
jgi:hypothetical protein